ncbi:carbohydrate esterase family 5 protein [Hypoxylon sp. FL0890]|nr:carbohydrate esterase family 5 protein [Hypoxylon sp. FL0890]
MFARVDPRYVALLSLSIVFLALVKAQETGLDTCTDVHIFLSRGNNEPYPGRQGKLVQAICSGLASCDYEDIVFDNALTTEYCGAVEAGREAGIEQITAYNKRCPDTKLVVSGYSQGAQVVGDILGGGGGVFFQGCTTPTVTGLDPNSAPANKIAAALLFGNTRHTANQSYNTLAGASINGLFPRSGQQLAGLDNFAGVLRDWCQGDDPVCASGDGKRTYNVQDHLNYFDLYSGAAGEWVKSKLGETTTSSSSSTTASSSSSTTASSTAATSTTSRISTQNSTATATSTLRPEVTISSSSASPTATSGSQPEGGTEIVRCSKSYIGLGVFIWLLLMAV